MKSCAYCGQENDEAAVTCRGCGTEFPLPVVEEDRSQFEDPALSPVVLKTFSTVVDAEMLRTRLDDAGIDAQVPEEYTPQILWSLVPSHLETVTVRVPAKEYESAKALLAEWTAAEQAMELAETAETPEPPVVPPATEPGKACVACRAAIPLNAGECPECGWTQP